MLWCLSRSMLEWCQAKLQKEMKRKIVKMKPKLDEHEVKWIWLGTAMGNMSFVH